MLAGVGSAGSHISAICSGGIYHDSSQVWRVMKLGRVHAGAGNAGQWGILTGPSSHQPWGQQLRNKLIAVEPHAHLPES